MSKNVKEIQQDVLEVFKEEIPSLYFSDKSESDYQNHCEIHEYFYHDLLKLPPRMFENHVNFILCETIAKDCSMFFFSHPGWNSWIPAKFEGHNEGVIMWNLISGIFVLYDEN